MVYIMIVLSGIILASSLALSTTGVLSGKRMQRYTQSADIRMLSQYCAETALMAVRNNTAIATTATTTQGTGTCTYTISGTSPNKIIDVTAIKNNLYKRIRITVTRVSPSILTTWVEGN